MNATLAPPARPGESQRLLEEQIISQICTIDHDSQPRTIRAALDAGLTAEHFQDERHGELFKALCLQLDSTGTIDPFTAILELSDAGTIEEGEVSTLADLTRRDDVSTLTIKENVSKLRTAAAKRKAKHHTRRAGLYLDEADTIRAAAEMQLASDALEGVGTAQADTTFQNLSELWSSDIDFAKPTIGAFGDGCALFYENSSNCLIGPRGSSKSWIALFITAELIAQGWHVVYIDPESTAKRILWRLKYLGLDPEAGTARFHYLGTTDASKIAEAQRWSARHDNVFVVYDGLANAIASLGKEENSSAALEVLQAEVKPFVDAGATTLTIDHTGKNESKGARGHSSKEAFFKGAVYQLETVKHFSRGQGGHARLVLTKDNEGGCGTIQGKAAANFRATIEDSGKTTFSIEEADDAEDPRPGPSAKMTDQEIWDCLPVGPERALNFNSLAPALNVRRFTDRCRAMPGVTVEARKNANHREENFFYREPSAPSSSNESFF